MPASKNPGPQDQKKRKEWSTPRLRLLGNCRPQNEHLAPRILEPIGSRLPAADGPDH